MIQLEGEDWQRSKKKQVMAGKGQVQELEAVTKDEKGWACPEIMRKGGRGTKGEFRSSGSYTIRVEDEY